MQKKTEAISWVHWGKWGWSVENMDVLWAAEKNLKVYLVCHTWIEEEYKLPKITVIHYKKEDMVYYLLRKIQKWERKFLKASYGM